MGWGGVGWGGVGWGGVGWGGVGWGGVGWGGGGSHSLYKYVLVFLFCLPQQKRLSMLDVADIHTSNSNRQPHNSSTTA